MNMKYRKLSILAGAAIVCIMMYSLAAVADKTVYLPIISKAESNTTHYQIGDRGPAGGIVFFVHTDGQHGLEAAPADQSTGIRWYNGKDTYTEALGDGIGAGEMNTMLIISKQGNNSNSYAAGLCANLVITNGDNDYGDWYLPSKDELNLLYLQKDIVDGLTTKGVYWSSTESKYSNTLAWGQFFDKGIQREFSKFTIPRIHAIRAF